MLHPPLRGIPKRQPEKPSLRSWARANVSRFSARENPLYQQHLYYQKAAGKLYHPGSPGSATLSKITTGVSQARPSPTRHFGSISVEGVGETLEEAHRLANFDETAPGRSTLKKTQEELESEYDSVQTEKTRKALLRQGLFSHASFDDKLEKEAQKQSNNALAANDIKSWTKWNPPQNKPFALR